MKTLAQANTHANELKPYKKPELKNPGSLAELTQGFAGSIPDEQGGHTKRNPFQG
ncbi:lasso RiPP family leader peptide-containing protein [Catenovulum agarivorans]|uniref:lasso RiPP family leader peptide-containing protein n=1 Tax=Catenovulum agarivorans TaxID=1172192 RepID=UPI00031B359A|nr:lasso RiPP family leader peptide-containing protein [Catenovulum agarivorans]